MKKIKKYFFCILKIKKSDPELDPDPYLEPNPDPFVRGTDSDPHQNVTDPQHCLSPCQQHSIKSWVGLVKVMVRAVLHKF
jgi:hypothetical protein